ncbi:MAG: hypothetical protein V3U88_10810 [Methylococcales bacterium]
MGYIEPKGKIIEASETGNVSRLVIEFDRMDSAPITPAGLYINPKKGSERYQLHKVIKIEGSVYTFETFDSCHPIPKQGDEYSYRGWWLPEAMDAALDTSEKWEKRKYPDNGNHEHCLFSWETIASYAECSEGYYSEKYGWITCESYNDFIVGDIYRLRSEIHA